MIKKIIIEDFFAFKGKTTIKLNCGVNILLGINGSGKTSFINAIRLLAEGVSGDGLMKLIQEQWGGFDEVVNFNGENSPSFAQITYVFSPEKLNKIHPAIEFGNDVFYQIRINRSGNDYILGEKMWTNNKDGQFIYLDFLNGAGRVSTRNEDNGSISLKEMSGFGMSGRELALRQINDPVHYLPLYVVRKAIGSIAVYSGFNVGEGGNLRRPTDYAAETRLSRSGSNLSLILNEMKLRNSFAFARLESDFRKVNTNFIGIEIDTPYGKPYLTLRERNMRRAVGALHVSDGTLRFLLMECIFYNPLRGDIVAVDEPERGLHPDMIKTVSDMIKHASESSQMIIATHSPHLLNQFSLSDILVFEKNEDNIAVVSRPDAADFPEMEENGLLPGQMWMMGLIGGKRW